MKKVILHSALHVNSTVSVTVSYTFSTCPAHPNTSLSPRQCIFLTDTCGNGKWKRKRKVRVVVNFLFLPFFAFIFFCYAYNYNQHFHQHINNKERNKQPGRDKRKKLLALTFLFDDQHSHHPHPRQQDRYCRHPWWHQILRACPMYVASFSCASNTLCHSHPTRASTHLDLPWHDFDLWGATQRARIFVSPFLFPYYLAFHGDFDSCEMKILLHPPPSLLSHHPVQHPPMVASSFPQQQCPRSHPRIRRLRGPSAVQTSSPCSLCQRWEPVRSEERGERERERERERDVSKQD